MREIRDIEEAVDGVEKDREEGVDALLWGRDSRTWMPPIGLRMFGLTEFESTLLIEVDPSRWSTSLRSGFLCDGEANDELVAEAEAYDAKVLALRSRSLCRLKDKERLAGCGARAGDGERR